jgi:HAD superfamily phosphatase
VENRRISPEPLVVFDMDGVLVEVTESYRDTVIATVRHFTGREITRLLVQEYKNRGGFNNDWKLSQQIARDLGVEVDYPVVFEKFKSIFWGNGTDGLILREKWIAEAGLLERLQERFGLAIFTGRMPEEVDDTLRRLAPHLRFNPIIRTGDVANGKPAPDGLVRIAELAPDRELVYIGDSVDDARTASAAGVPFIGIAAPAQPCREELVRLFRDEGAVHILESINQLESVL